MEIDIGISMERYKKSSLCCNYYTTKMRKNIDWYAVNYGAIIINPDRLSGNRSGETAHDYICQEECILSKKECLKTAGGQVRSTVKQETAKQEMTEQKTVKQETVEQEMVEQGTAVTGTALEQMQFGRMMELVSDQMQIGNVLEMNQYTQKYGLALSEEDAQIIIAERRNTLMAEKRVEFGQGILPRLIYEFCDSSYISQDNYLETMVRLQEIFYFYKNETMDELTDNELIHFMKEQFETVCYGDLEYLEGTCLEIFSQAVRSGYGGYRRMEGRGEYSRFDEVKRWDPELYVEALKGLQ